jgi:hypothetical protein
MGFHGSKAMAFLIAGGRRVTVIAGVTALVVTGSSVAAFASGGTSGMTNGCYSTWGNTGSSYHCPRVTVTGYYQNHLACDKEQDKTSPWSRLTAGSSVDNIGQVNCRFKASSAYVAFHG